MSAKFTLVIYKTDGTRQEKKADNYMTAHALFSDAKRNGRTPHLFGILGADLYSTKSGLKLSFGVRA